MTTIRRMAASCFWASAVAVRLGAQGWQPSRCVSDTLSVVKDSTVTTATDSVAPGIGYRCVLDRRGPWVLHVVTVQLGRPDLRLTAERAAGRFLGRETVSAMAARLAAASQQPLVGLNADFFDLGSGEVENNQVASSEWVKGALRTDSPHDVFDNAHTQFGVDARGRPLMGRFAFRGAAIADGRRHPLAGINYRQAGIDGLVLYSPWFGARTASAADSAGLPALPPTPSAAAARSDSTRRVAFRAMASARELELRRLGRRADTVLYRVVSRRLMAGGGNTIPSAGAVLSAVGDSAIRWLERAATRRAVIKVVQGIDLAPGAMQTIVGGWPRVVEDGVNIAAEADRREGTFPSFSGNRHPRSAIGLSRDSTQLLLAVVDGRRAWSVGMTLAELGDAMLGLGAYQAMNLDGGGSSALWVRGQVVNAPSDRTGERAVGNALFVMQAPVPARSRVRPRAGRSTSRE